MKTKRPPITVAIAVPSQEMLHTRFALSLVNLITYIATRELPGYVGVSAFVINKRGSILPNLRWQALRDADKVKADYILWLDSDHTFPPDILHRLLSHNQDVVAVNCATKSVPAYPTARQYDELDPKGKPVYTFEDSTGLEPVWRVGFGITLMSRRAYKALSGYDFEMNYVLQHDIYRGEDWNAFASLDRQGFKFYIDHDLSKVCKHIGMFDYDHSLTIPEMD